ncbi:MAG: DNA primase [Phycisphaerae bacterium]
MSDSARFEQWTRRVAQAIDIADLIGQHVKLSRAGKDLRGLCPFHQEKTPSFYVSPAKQIFKCFGCGAGGDAFKFIQLREKVSFSEARDILAERVGIPLERGPRGAPTGETDRATLARVNEWAVSWFRRQLSQTPAGHAAREYALGRGLTAGSIDAWEIGFAPESWDQLKNASHAAKISAAAIAAAGLARRRDDGGLYDTFRNRLMFPIRDGMNRVVGFGGRALGDDPAKYLNTPQTPLFDKGRCLFGLHKARDSIASGGKAVVVEGYLDCVMAHQFGFAATVATLGTALTADHAAALRRFADSVILVFDSDAAGERAVERALPIFLSQRLEVRLARVTEGKDPCDFLLAAGAEAFKTVLNGAIGALESKWQGLRDRYRGESGLSGRHRAVQQFLDDVAAAGDWGSIDPIQRGLIVNQVAKLLEIGRNDVESALRRRPARSQPAPPQEAVPAESAGSAGRSAHEGPIDLAMRELLEAVLNDPGLTARVTGHLDPSRLADEELRRIATLVVDMIREAGTVDVAGLYSRLDSPASGQRLTDLIWTGETRGNLEAVVTGAIARIEQEVANEAAGGLRQVFREPSAATADLDEAARERMEIARRCQHFAARKHLRQNRLGSEN